MVNWIPIIFNSPAYLYIYDSFIGCPLVPASIEVAFSTLGLAGAWGSYP